MGRGRDMWWQGMLWKAGCCAGVVGIVVLAVGTAEGFRQTIGTELRVTQVRPAKEKGAKDDPKIAKDVISFLRGKYGYRYTLEGQEAREAHLGVDEEFALANGEKLTLRVTGYTPAKQIIDLKIQTATGIRIVTVTSGDHLLFTYGDDKDRLLVVVSATLLQVDR